MKRSLQFDALEERDLQSLFGASIAVPAAGATQAGAGVGSVASALAAHAVTDQSAVSQPSGQTDAMPNPMDPIDGSVHGQGVLPSPIDPAQGGIPKFHSVSP